MSVIILNSLKMVYSSGEMYPGGGCPCTPPKEFEAKPQKHFNN